MVSGNLTTVQGERTVVDDTTTVVAVVTTLDLTFAHDCQRTIVDDDASVSLCACEVSVQVKTVQVKHYRLACRYYQCTVSVPRCQTIAQLQYTTVSHRCIEGCPTGNGSADFVHISLGNVAVDSHNLTVVVRRNVQGLLRHTRLCRQGNYQVIGEGTVAVVRLRSLCKVTERNLDLIVTTHKGSFEGVRLGALCVAENAGVNAVTRPYIIAKSGVEFCQDGKLIHVRHNRLDIVVGCQTCDSGCCADGRTACVNLYYGEVAERHITLDSRIAASRVTVNQTTGHPEAYCAVVGYAVVYTCALCGVVSGNLTTVQGERTVVHNTTTVAGIVTTADLCTTYVVRNSQRTVINDHASVSLCCAEVTIQGVTVQVKYDCLTYRYDQSTVEVRSRQTLAQLQDTTVRHSCIQICPACDSTADLVHIGLSDITVDTRDLTVAVNRYVQYLVAQPRLCRQVDIQIIRVTTVTVTYFLCLCKVTERNLDCISTTHEGSLERVRLGALCIGDHTCCVTITCPYIIAESIVQLLQDIVDGRGRSRSTVAGKAQLA